ncbi:oligopeptide:H+ symporter [[Clostridium] innocuum]|nr:oligopeptide:H+ symporter [[Clostridium] innocuum]MCR0578886.1 oligopeptide:H+ symporter [[Clostridium] innocuum]
MNTERNENKQIDPQLEAVYKDRKFFGHPRGLGALAAGNFFNSFAWGGVYAILIYYLYSPYTKGLGFTQGEAASMIAAMGACNSLFVIVGSWLSDRVLGPRKALVVGNVVKAISFGLLAVPAFSLTQGRIFAVLSLILMSLPIMGAANPSMTGLLYRSDDDGRRDAAFTIHNVANAITGMISPILIGFIGMSDYHLGFFISAMAALAYGLVILFTGKRFFGTIGEKPANPVSREELKKAGLLFAGVVILLLAGIGITVSMGVMNFDGILNIITTFSFVIPIVFLYKMYTNKNIIKEEHTKMKPFLKIWCVQCVVALSAVLLNTALAVFIEAKIDRNFMGIEFAPATFTSIYNLLGLVMGAFFVWVWGSTKFGKLKVTKKFSIGVLVNAAAYAVLAVPVLTGGKGSIFSPLWVVGYYFILTIGDNFINPIGVSMTAKLAPASYETQMQSAWQQSNSIANGISIIAFKFFVTADQQMMIFPIMTVLLVGTCLVLLKMSKKIDAIV